MKTANWKNKDFTEIYNDYYPLVLTTLENKTSSIDDARDIAQEIFISVYKNLDTIENMRKWLYGAMKNQLNSYYQVKYKDVNVNIEDVLNSASLTFVNGFRDTRIMLQEAIDDPENYTNDSERVLFDLIAVKQFSYEQAGTQLGMTKRKARYHYDKIVNRVLANLAKRGIKDLEDIL